MAYDPLQDAEIVFGGERVDDAALRAGVGLNNRTWRWDEFGGWQQEVDVVRFRPDPSPRGAFAIATGTRDILMFGGIGPGGQPLDETWDWIGSWDNTGIFDRGAPPPPRSSAAMAYDASRGQFVLFGGAGSDGVLSDTWERSEFDSSGWHAKSPVHRPPARRGHAMVYDTARKRIVLFGGAGDDLLGDTWEWDGTDWTQRTPATAPSPRTGAAMAYDAGRGRLVLFGGTDGSWILDETWEWDGAIWQQRTPAHEVPPARRAHAMVFDALRGHVVMFGGVHDDTAVPVGLLDDVWEWDGVDWQSKSSAKKLPPPRSGHVMSYDLINDITVMFGGVDGDAGRLLDDSWEWDGAQWFRSGGGAPARTGHAFVWPMMFGGQDSLTSTDLLNDSWHWFYGWDNEHRFLRPPPRFGHAMARDSTGAVMVFGGTGYAGLLSDQWATSALGWTQVVPATVPAKRTGSAAVYDAARKRLVLFGGQGESSLLGDVWEWDGTTWSDHSPESVVVPTPRTGHTLVYNDKRHRAVLFGGRSEVGALNDMWEWDGTTWTALPITPQSPPPRHHHAMTYDAKRDTLVLFGGDGRADHPLQDTWLFRYDGPAAPPETCSTCSFDCGACHTCGDFHCDPKESCSSCPGDCGSCP
jgi:galactose oxidase-like protein